MGLMSTSVSVSRFRVEGKLETPEIETVAKGLKKNALSEIEDAAAEKTVGWTPFRSPYRPLFEDRSFVVGEYLVFSLRIDRKSIPSKVLKKEFAEVSVRRLAESGRPYLSRSEKKMIREEVAHRLILRIPATPNLYDLVWSLDRQSVWFFSTLKSANEELETLFAKSFRLTLVRLFPFTMADLTAGLSDKERDLLERITPTPFTP
ncbi:MAG: recombination-associated protein RdgC [Desulfobacterales bacterium]|nr:recombination-associated protein RdgC [Desulfobacterales bacterium]